MSLKQFTFASLGDLDNGRVAAALNEELRKVAEDISDRPANKTARKVTMEMSFSPSGDAGTVEAVAVDVKCKSSVPSQQTRTYTMKMHGGNRLMFNPEAPENPRQHTIDEQIRPRGDADRK